MTVEYNKSSPRVPSCSSPLSIYNRYHYTDHIIYTSNSNSSNSNNTMKLPAFIITLICLTTTILCAAVPPANLLACTLSTNGLTVCGSHNDIFKCNSLTWTLLTTCTDPNAPCKNGTCTPSSSFPCAEGETKCVTTSPSTGIQVCKKGNWEIQQSCHCTTTTTKDGKAIPQCVSLKRNDVPSPVAEGCSEGEVKCLAVDENGRDGAVYKCNGIGRWDIIQDCSQYEKCVMEPWAHCTWVGAFGV